MMKSIIRFSVFWILFFIYIPAGAKTLNPASFNENYAYIGVRAGYTYNQNSCTNSAFNCDHTGAGYGVFSGYQFTQSIVAEISYNDLGDSTAEYLDLRLVGQSSEIDLALLFSHKFNNSTEIYAKAGPAYWDGEVTGRDSILKESRVRFLLGTGAEFYLSPRWNARVEYQYIHQVGNSQMGYANPHMVGIALLWKLPGKKNVVSDVKHLPLESPPSPKIKPPKPEPEKRIVINEEHGGPLFDSNKFEIRHTKAIDEVIALLLNNQNLHVTIVGHTDSRGSHEFNKSLSENRARAVANYLYYNGVDLDRIKIFGMGEDEPVADNETEQGRSKNRRVEFVISAIKKSS